MVNLTLRVGFAVSCCKHPYSHICTGKQLLSAEHMYDRIITGCHQQNGRRLALLPNLFEKSLQLGGIAYEKFDREQP